MKKKYNIVVDCANCANKMEDKINKIDGVENATINFMMGKLIVDYKDTYNEKEVFNEILKACRKVHSDVEIN